MQGWFEIYDIQKTMRELTDPLFFSSVLKNWWQWSGQEPLPLMTRGLFYAQIKDRRGSREREKKKIWRFFPSFPLLQKQNMFNYLARIIWEHCQTLHSTYRICYTLPTLLFYCKGMYQITWEKNENYQNSALPNKLIVTPYYSQE